MSDSRVIIVDGYNVIHRSPELRPGPDRSLQESRAKLVNLLSWAVGSGEARFIVVFDGTQGGGQAAASHRLEVRFSRAPEKADDVIRRLVEDRIDHGERVTVVTADLEVARHARAMGGDVSIADLFLASVLEPGRTGETGEGKEERPTTLSKRELEEWAALFRSRAKPVDPDAEPPA